MRSTCSHLPALANPYKLLRNSPSRPLPALARSTSTRSHPPPHRVLAFASPFALAYQLPAAPSRTFFSLPNTNSSSSSSAMSDAKSFYELKAQLPGGKTYDFEQLKGKVVLIVNTASKWYAGSVVLSVL